MRMLTHDSKSLFCIEQDYLKLSLWPHCMVNLVIYLNPNRSRTSLSCHSCRV